MDYKTLTKTDTGILLSGVTHFTLAEVLDNGQAFRWKEQEDGSFQGIAHKQLITLQQIEDSLRIDGITPESFASTWKTYFDFETDYSEIIQLFSTDKVLKEAIQFAPGLRLLQQEPWEALATFILSQNNNIKRIKGLVQRFCENFGDPIVGGYAFPEVETIATLTIDDLAPVRAGFRSKYLIDAAQKIASGTVSLELPYTLPIEQAREHLQQIHGVGPKVADCVLLFGFHRVESFPVDVWMKRALETFYPKGFPKKLQPWAGIAQQYLFHYTRLNEHLLVMPEKSKKKS